ncbi:cyclic beta-1,2-glucan synthase [Lachnospiraceae bacterium KM106-2]|nr:cyclic beta-1,2-glucan synthase [Lachnospiraceae bacterium KM106-2]
MKTIEYTNIAGNFKLDDPELNQDLYFPIANESGVMGSITPDLGGDLKTGQNSFLLEPVSVENLHNNKNTRNFWCVFEDGTPWSVCGRSAEQQAKLFQEEKENTTLEAGLLWQEVTRTSKKYGVKAKVTSFVPSQNIPFELMKVSIKNESDHTIVFRPVASIPVYGRSADNIRDHRHVTSLLHRIRVVDNGVLVTPTLSFDERGHQKNEVTYGVFARSARVSVNGYYPTVESFLGEGGTYEVPRALYSKEMPVYEEGYSCNGREALGGISFESCSLTPGEEVQFIIGLGFGSEETLQEQQRKYIKAEEFEHLLEDTKKEWEKKINIHFAAGDERFGKWMQWVNAQPILRRIYGCSFLPHHDYGKGGRGWRDLWQDCLALLIMDPKGVRQMLLDNFGGVRFDGTNATIIGNNQGEFIADRNNITRVWMDHGVWPLITTNLYIQQSGDIHLLLEENSYFKDPQYMRGDKKDILWKPEQGNQVRCEDGTIYRGNLLEHLLLQHLSSFYDVGEHNQIRLRGADWNDAMDLAKDRGESVAFTAMYGGNFITLAELVEELSRRGTKEIAVAKEIVPLLQYDNCNMESVKSKVERFQEYCENTIHTISGEKVSIECDWLSTQLRQFGQWIKKHITETEWITDEKDHSWFNGYYDNAGKRVEGDHTNGVRMILTSQVFAIMSHTASEEQIKKIIEAADAYLYKKEAGGYRLNTDFHEIKMDLGRMFGFAYGTKENGAVFSHMAIMYANALYSRGFVKAGFKVMNTLYEHCLDFEKSHIYPGIPEYIDASGRGMYHYLTGAASWFMLTVLTQMYGVKGHMGDLVIEPGLTKEQFRGGCKTEVDCMFAERKIHVTYENKENLEYGQYHICSVKTNIEQIEVENARIRISREELVTTNKDQVIEIVIQLGK